jgi:DNA-binding NarL/FixJ family response regulator
VINVAIISPTLAVRAGLRTLLTGGEEVKIVAEAARLSDLKPLSPETSVVILDADAASRPELEEALLGAEGVALLLLDPGDTGAARLLPGLPLRAWGILPLDSTAEELLAAAGALHEGLFVGPPALVESLLVQIWEVDASVSEMQSEPFEEQLTGREAEVLQLLAQGLANKQIALALGISEHTVKFHVSAIYTKLGANNRAEAVSLGVRKGLVVL